MSSGPQNGCALQQRQTQTRTRTGNWAGGLSQISSPNSTQTAFPPFRTIRLLPTTMTTSSSSSSTSTGRQGSPSPAPVRMLNTAASGPQAPSRTFRAHPSTRCPRPHRPRLLRLHSSISPTSPLPRLPTWSLMAPLPSHALLLPQTTPHCCPSTFPMESFQGPDPFPAAHPCTCPALGHQHHQRHWLPSDRHILGFLFPSPQTRC